MQSQALAASITPGYIGVMYSFLAFAFTFTQLLVAGISYATESTTVFYTLVVYGSPFYLAMNMATQFSVFFDASPVYLMLLCYHLIKYFIFFRAQVSEERTVRRILAVLFEAAYLGIAAYYMN